MPHRNMVVTPRVFDAARLTLAHLSPSRDAPLRTILQKVCELSAETLQVERVGIWLLVEDRAALRCINLFECSKNEHSEGATLRVADFPNYFASLDQLKSIPVAVAASDPKTSELAEAYLQPLNITSMLDAPIFLEGRVIGVVCHEHTHEPREWTNEQRDFASAVADTVALKLGAAQWQEAQAIKRQLGQQQSEIRRLESLGQLAAGVAHDFKNMLAVIMGSAELLARNKDLSDTARRLLAHIMEAAERGASMTDDLMHYARNNTRATKVVRVDDLIKQALPLMRRAVGANHSIHYTSSASPGQVLIEGASLERVLLNLILNARDAMPDGGVIELRLNGNTKSPDSQGREVNVTLEITDHGIGMSPEVQQHIFEPFYTTKGSGKGTGLGLAVVKQIVDRAGGFVQVQSELGQGTTFTIGLPRIKGD